MSECAGGSIIIGAVAGGVAISALTAGTLVLGTGYLICKGGYRAVKSCKEAWDAHLKELEEERQRHFKELRKADEAQLERLQGNLSQWALDSEETIRQNEERLCQEFAKERAQIMEDQCKLAENSASWKRLRLLDDELKYFKDGLSIASSSTVSRQDKDDYQRELEKAREQLKKQAECSPIEKISIEKLIQTPTPQVSYSETSSVDTGDFKKQLAIFRARLAGLLFISSQDRNTVWNKINSIEQSLGNDSVANAAYFKTGKNELQKLLSEVKEINEKRRMGWEKVQEIYFSLFDRYTTASQDPTLKEVIKGPLEELHNVLEKAKQNIQQPWEDPDISLDLLKNGHQQFDNKVEDALLAHQHSLNQEVKKVLAKVLIDLGYSETKPEETESTILVTGTGLKEHKEAEVCFSLSADGYLSVDVSHKGYKNQSECTKEFIRIQQALQERGIHVELREHKKTWMSEMVKFLAKKLENMGYSKDSIKIETVNGGQRITTCDTEDIKKEITIDEKTGQWTEASGPEVSSLKTVVSIENEEDEEEDEEEERLHI